MLLKQILNAKTVIDMLVYEWLIFFLKYANNLGLP